MRPSICAFCTPPTWCCCPLDDGHTRKTQQHAAVSGPHCRRRIGKTMGDNDPQKRQAGRPLGAWQGNRGYASSVEHLPGPSNLGDAHEPPEACWLMRNLESREPAPARLCFSLLWATAGPAWDVHFQRTKAAPGIEYASHATMHQQPNYRTSQAKNTRGLIWPSVAGLPSTLSPRPG